MKFTFTWNETEKERDDFEKSYLHSLSILKGFISVNHLDEVDASHLIDEVLIYHEHSDFKKMLVSKLLMKKEDILPSFVGTIHDHKLYIMTKSYYFDHNTSAIEVHGYEKLIAHELAHAYHIFLLNGKEDDMGPLWFFEGFAIFASGQFCSRKDILSQKHLERILFSNDRMFYPLYKSVFSEMILHFPIKELIFEASKPGFSEKIYHLIKEKEEDFISSSSSLNKIQSLQHANQKRDYVLLILGEDYDDFNEAESNQTQKEFYEAGYHCGVYLYRNQKLRYPFIFEEGIEFLFKLRQDPFIKNIYLCGLSMGAHFALYLLEKASSLLTGGLLIDPYVSNLVGGYDEIAMSNLLGKSPSKIELKELSLEKLVHSDMPSIWIKHRGKKAKVHALHSILLLEALTKESVLREAHFVDDPNWIMDAISFLKRTN